MKKKTSHLHNVKLNKIDKSPKEASLQQEYQHSLKRSSRNPMINTETCRPLAEKSK